MKFLKDANAVSQALLLFVCKITVLFVLSGLFFIIMMPDLSGVKFSLTKIFSEEKTKILMLSFIQNPEVLYKLSEIAERNGSTSGAIRDVELAIGLLEMHGADRRIVERYSDRAIKLKALEGIQP